MPRAASARMPEVLRAQPQFRLLFWGQILSIIGDRVTFVAMPFAVLESGGGTKEVGLVAGATALPFLIFSLAAGVWADRVDRRRIMVASDCLRMLCQAVAGVLLISGAAEPWHLVVIGLVYGTADAFFGPAMYGLLPQIVDPSHLQSANALRGLSMSAGMVAGPAIAGVLVALVGPGGALLADAATFAVSVTFLVRMRPNVVERAEAGEPDFLTSLREGWREVRARSWVWAMLLGLAVYHVIVLPSVFVLGPVLAQRELGGAGSWALITVGFGTGAVLGQLLLLRWKPDRALFASAAALIGASCQAAIIGSGLPVVAIAALEALTAICVQIYFTLWETSIQEQVPENAVSRVGSYDLLVSVGLLPIGAVVVGPIADAAGLHTSLKLMSAIGVAIAVAILAVPSVRHLRRPPSVWPAPA
jgi:MFS family permease